MSLSGEEEEEAVMSTVPACGTVVLLVYVGLGDQSFRKEAEQWKILWGKRIIISSGSYKVWITFRLHFPLHEVLPPKGIFPFSM